MAATRTTARTAKGGETIRVRVNLAVTVDPARWDTAADSTDPAKIAEAIAAATGMDIAAATRLASAVTGNGRGAAAAARDDIKAYVLAAVQELPKVTGSGAAVEVIAYT